MADVIRFPRDLTCRVCGSKLRPTTSREIRDGLASTNPVVRQAFLHAVQGDMAKKFLVENSFTHRMEGETPPGSWLLICDACGMKSVHMVEDQEQ